MHNLALRHRDKNDFFLSRTYLDKLKKQAHNFSGDYKMKVLYGQYSCLEYRDGEGIYVMYLAPMSIPGLDFMERVRMNRATVIHECGHRLYSDYTLLIAQPGESMSQAEKIAQQHNMSKKIFHQTWNVIEDRWQERLVVRNYPGTAQDIWWHDQTAANAHRIEGDAFSQLSKLIMLYAIAYQDREGECTIPEIIQPYREAQRVVKDYDGATSTSDNLEAAILIYEIMRPFIQTPHADMPALRKEMVGRYESGETPSGEFQPAPWNSQASPQMTGQSDDSSEPQDGQSQPAQLGSGSSSPDQNQQESKLDVSQSASGGNSKSESGSEKSDGDNEPAGNGTNDQDDEDASSTSQGRPSSERDDESCTDDQSASGTSSNPDTDSDVDEETTTGSGADQEGEDEQSQDDDDVAESGQGQESGDNDGDQSNGDSDVDSPSTDSTDVGDDSNQNMAENESDTDNPASGDVSAESQDKGGDGEDSDGTTAQSGSDADTEDSTSLEQTEPDPSARKVEGFGSEEDLMREFASEQKQEQNLTDKIRQKSGDITVSDPLEPMKITVDYSRTDDLSGEDEDDYRRILMEHRAVIRAMDNQFKMLYDDEDVFIPNQMTGTRMTNLLRKDGKVFEKKLENLDNPRPAIAVLADMSGSMGGRVEAVRTTLIILQEFCTLNDIPFAVITHQAKGGKNEVVIRGEKWFEEPSSTMSGFIPNQNTREGVSLEWVAKYIQRQGYEKNWLIVLSDGQPMHSGRNSHYMGEVAEKDVRQREKILRRMGIYPVGVGLNVDISNLYQQSIRVDDMSELPKRLFTIIKRKVMVYQ